MITTGNFVQKSHKKFILLPEMLPFSLMIVLTPQNSIMSICELPRIGRER